MGEPHKIVSFGDWLTHIGVQHLVLGSTTLERNTWFRIEPHKTATLLYDFTSEVLQSDVIEIKTKFWTLMCVNQWPNDTVKYSSSFYQSFWNWIRAWKGVRMRGRILKNDN